MSNEILNRLRDAHAFKPKPPDHELASAHVHVGDVGIANPIDDRVAAAMTQQGEAFTMVIGPPGCGKSSLLASSITTVATDLDLSPAPVPLKVPVAMQLDRLTPDLLVRGITQSLANTLGSVLSAADLARLERNLSTTIATAQHGRAVTASLIGGVPFLHGELGVELGKDLVTMTTRSEWQGGGPIARLESLHELATAQGGALVVVFDDTDIWSVGDDQMAARARDFFSALRALKDCRWLRVLVTIQTHWTETATTASAVTRAAQHEFQELAERVETRLTVPRPQSATEAEALITAVIARRVERALAGQPDSGERLARALFSPEARELLGRRCFTRSVRKAINDIRDAFDHLSEMPNRIGIEHLVEVIDE